MFAVRYFARRSFSKVGALALEPISKHQDWVSVVELDENPELYGSDIPPRRFEEQGRTYLTQAKQFFIDRKYEDALNSLNKAFDSFKLAFSDEYSEYFNIEESTAKNLFRLGRYEEGFEHAKKALNLSYKHLVNRNEICLAEMDMAWAYTQMGEFEKAEEIYRRCVNMMEAENEDIYHETYVQLMDDFGLMWEKKGDYDKAADYLYDALASVNHVKAEEMTTKARILTHIAELNRKMGDLEESLRCATLAKDLYELSKPEDNPPELAWCYNIIGWDHLNKGRYEDAKIDFLKGTSLETKIHGKEEAEMREAWSGLRQVYDKMGDTGKIKKLEDKHVESEPQV